MTKRKELGPFHRGALVCHSSYSMGGCIRRMYGKVFGVDTQRQLIIWRALGETKHKISTTYPPPAPEEPSRWKLRVVGKGDVPEQLHKYI